MVDFEFYALVYCGQNFADEAEFSPYVDFAGDDVNALTGWRLDEDELSTNVKKAICAQADYLFDNGISPNDFASAGLGKFNYSKSNTNSKKQHYADRVYNYLEPTGLLYRGI